MVQVTSQTELRDTIFFVKTLLASGITDPVSSTRAANESFIMTSYPQKPVNYPIITIKDTNTVAGPILGFQSQAMSTREDMEIRIWANTVSQRDKLADQVFYLMRTNQSGTNGSYSADLHDLKLLSSINIDEPDGPKSKVQTYQYMFVATN